MRDQFLRVNSSYDQNHDFLIPYTSKVVKTCTAFAASNIMNKLDSCCGGGIVHEGGLDGAIVVDIAGVNCFAVALATASVLEGDTVIVLGEIIVVAFKIAWNATYDLSTAYSVLLCLWLLPIGAGVACTLVVCVDSSGFNVSGCIGIFGNILCFGSIFVFLGLWRICFILSSIRREVGVLSCFINSCHLALC